MAFSGPPAMPTAPLEPGLELSGRWKLGKQLGAGAFGQVFEGACVAAVVVVCPCMRAAACSVLL